MIGWRLRRRHGTEQGEVAWRHLVQEDAPGAVLQYLLPFLAV
jgi:hypothetical protein